MQLRTIRKILKDTDFVHFSATAEETQVARYLQEMAEKLGAQTHLEAFPVPVSEMHGASLTVDGREIPCEGYRLCGSGEIEAPLCYLPNTDPASLAKAKGKIVLIKRQKGPVRQHPCKGRAEAGQKRRGERPDHGFPDGESGGLPQCHRRASRYKRRMDRAERAL